MVVLNVQIITIENNQLSHWFLLTFLLSILFENELKK